jgi:hypothetical protein
VSAVLRLWPAQSRSLWRREGPLAELWAFADGVLAAPSRQGLWALAVEADGRRAQALVSVDAALGEAMGQAGCAPAEGDPLEALGARLEAAEIAAAAGTAALVQAWNLSPRDEIRLAEQAQALEGAWLWGIPGARLVAVLSGSDPPDAARAWAEEVRAAGGTLAVSSAAPAWKAIEAPHEPTWDDWTRAIERAMGTLGRSAEEVTA